MNKKFYLFLLNSFLWVLLIAIFAYDAISDLDSGHMYSVIFKFVLCGFFFIRLVVGIFEYVRRRELRCRHLIDFIASLFVFLSILAAICIGFSKVTPDTMATMIICTVLGVVFNLLVFQYSIKSIRRYKSSGAR